MPVCRRLLCAAVVAACVLDVICLGDRVSNQAVAAVDLNKLRANLISKKHHGHHSGGDNDHGGDDNHSDVCHGWDWRKESLKLIKEIPVIGLFPDTKNITKFEASGMTKWKDGYVMVFDSLETLGFFDHQLDFMGSKNVLSGHAGEESQYEAIMPRTKTGTLLAVKEAIQMEHMHPVIVELQVAEDLEWSVLRECVVDFELQTTNKGLEGALYFDAGEEGEFLLGLCEGNHCAGGKKGREVGNGRVIVAKLVEEGDTCKWVTQKTINVPSTANFADYSAMDVYGDRMAITSQENSSVWIGYIDWAALEFKQGGQVLHFPRAEGCKAIYCNIEGVQWIDGSRLITTTDRAKKDQPWSCSAKDQSVQVFALPDNKYLKPEPEQ